MGGFESLNLGLFLIGREQSRDLVSTVLMG